MKNTPTFWTVWAGNCSRIRIYNHLIHWTLKNSNMCFIFSISKESERVQVQLTFELHSPWPYIHTVYHLCVSFFFYQDFLLYLKNFPSLLCLPLNIIIRCTIIKHSVVIFIPNGVCNMRCLHLNRVVWNDSLNIII